MSGRDQPPAVEGVVTIASPHSVEQTVERLRAILDARGVTLFAHIDHAANAREVGLSMHEAQVLVFGNPQAGTPAMVAAPLIALELPLRALVWSGADGQSWVSYLEPEVLARRFGVPADEAAALAAIEGLVTAAVAA